MKVSIAISNDVNRVFKEMTILEACTGAQSKNASPHTTPT